MSSLVKDDPSTFNQWIRENDEGYYLPMGITAENVAAKYGITREQMDAFAVDSHRKAAQAQEAGKFDGEIIPLPGLDEEGGAIRSQKISAFERVLTWKHFPRSNPALKKMALLPLQPLLRQATEAALLC
jgi:acetyl-CoA acyltransferase